MSEPTPAPDPKPDDSATKVDPKPDPQPDWEAKFNDLAAKHRKDGERLKALEKETKTKETEELVKSGNADKIRENAQLEIAAEKKRADDALAKLRTVTVEKDVRTLIAGLAADGLADDVWTLIKDFFDVSEDGTKAVVKESALSPQQFIAKWFDGKPGFAKNPQKGGGGAKKSGDGSTVQPGLPATFAAMSQSEQRDWFVKNPSFKPSLTRQE